MNDEDERVTEFVKILTSAVGREAENKALRAHRDELLKALEWYADTVEDLNRNGWTAGKALGQLRADRGKKALEAVAKAKGAKDSFSCP